LQRINISNKPEDLLEYLLDRIGILEDAYKNVPIINLVFSYGVREGKIISTLGNKRNKNIKFHKFYKNNLPIAHLPEDYGKVHYRIGDTYTIGVDKITVIIMECSPHDNINKIKYIKNNKLLFTWEDKIVSPNKIIREIGKSIYHFEDGKIKIFMLRKKTTGITNKILPKNNKRNNNFYNYGSRNFTNK